MKNMRRTTPSQRWGLWAPCASLAVHLLWVLSLSPGEPQAVRPPADQTHVEFELIGDLESHGDQVADERHAEPARSQPPTTAEATVTLPTRRSTARSKTAPLQERIVDLSPELLEPEAAIAKEAPLIAVESDASSLHEPQATRGSKIMQHDALDLDPRSVALGAFVAASCADSGVADDVAVLDRALATQRLNDHLAAATRAPHLVHREPPRLRSGTDGRYRYETPAFTAVIEPDGFVRFQDSSSAALHLSSTFLTFDINDAFERAVGNDPYAAEKRWFLAETKEMRRELAEQARLELMAKAGRRLRGSLLVILKDGRSLAEKHQAIFALWDDCAPDEVGEEGRRIIETFVREQMPQGGPLAFQPAELVALNSRRFNPEPFSPYEP